MEGSRISAVGMGMRAAPVAADGVVCSAGGSLIGGREGCWRSRAVLGRLAGMATHAHSQVTVGVGLRGRKWFVDGTGLL
jgi:hypothetical protein